MAPDDNEGLIREEVEKRLEDIFGADDDIADTEELPPVSPEQEEESAEGEPGGAQDEPAGAQDEPGGAQDEPEAAMKPAEEAAAEAASEEAAEEDDGTQSILLDQTVELDEQQEPPEGGDTYELKYDEIETVGDEADEQPDIQKDISSAPSSLKELEAIILSIEWEINDETMNSLIGHVEALKDVFKDDNVVVMFLRLLGSVGRYIRNNKANTHPGAITVLNSVYSNLEKIVLSEGMAENEREKALLNEIEAFKKLKQEITDQRVHRKAMKKGEASMDEKEGAPGLRGKPEPETPVHDAPVAGEAAGPEKHLEGHQMAAYEAFTFAVEELKEMLRSEFRALRAEIKLWREGQ